LKLPRPREFDEAAALEATMRGFGAGGFAATSVRDLGDAMGLGQASVYNAFGGKRALFTQCLDRYLDANMKARIARVDQSLPLRQAIETFLAEIVERSLESRVGCLLANAAPEIAPHDPEIAAVAAERMGELEVFFRRCVIAGERDGSISPGVDPGDVGRLLLRRRAKITASVSCFLSRHPRTCSGDQSPHSAGRDPRVEPGDDVKASAPIDSIIVRRSLRFLALLPLGGFVGGLGFGFRHRARQGRHGGELPVLRSNQDHHQTAVGHATDMHRDLLSGGAKLRRRDD
jgi:TetR/AcrR family transcriptional repressor of nem operon